MNTYYTKCHIKSLNMDFIEKVIAYLETNKGSGITGHSFNQDLSDCRRLISISVEQNKKGIAAKKKMIEELFMERSETKAMTTDTEYKCKDCAYWSTDGTDDIGECNEPEKNAKLADPNMLACDNFCPISTGDVVDCGEDEDWTTRIEIPYVIQKNACVNMVKECPYNAV